MDKLINAKPAVHRGPSLLLLILVYCVFLTASLLVPSVLRQRAEYVSPYESVERIRDFFAASPAAVRISGFLIFGSAIPLGLYTATVVSRLGFLGVRAAGTYITLFGGWMAAGALAVCGVLVWILSLPAVVASLSVVQAVNFLSFLFGGMVFAVGSGLLIAGLSVTGGLSKLLPRTVAVMGLVLALSGELSSLSLLTHPATVFLPMTRFGGLLWLIVAAVLLPQKRREEGDHA
ncbi:MAG: hypothetical protein JOY85_09810 [Acidobacteriaceae bacterium]|nr:hypothetical protein [Acidobacteriaceae bacterium]